MPSVMAPDLPYTNGRSAKLTNRHTFVPPESPTDSLSNEMDSTTLLPIHRRPSSKRKLSSPLMPAFMVSAPGKVIVYGEHAVVHGKTAIAAAISLRSYLLVTFLSKSKRTVTLKFPDIALDHTWNIDDLPWATFSKPGKKRSYYDLVTSIDPELMESLRPHITSVSPKAPEDTRKIHHSSVTSFLYLFLSLGSPKSPPCVYTLRSTIPIGAGLGSSGSIAVCLSCALLLQIRALSGPHQDQPSEESELQIERISRWAFVAELCVHGNPSGVDNTVSAGGKALFFQRPNYSKPPIVRPMRDFPELPLLLVNTGQTRSTATELAKVEKLKVTHPQTTNLVLDAIDSVTRSAFDLITQADFDPDDPDSLQHLGELITLNHGLLVSLGVSHPKLERIRALIDHTGIGWTKLTGAGGGGCAITILKPSSTTNTVTDPTHRADVLTALENSLEAEGFTKFETTLAGDGVGVLWPAVLQNASMEEGGEEIDQEKFLNAVGNEGIEALVGVTAGDDLVVGSEEAIREGWKFWRP
ncbi:mevalonate kinase [Venturia nashicola]|uniref:Mevalonate kinase n=1 Tax=Venturia nashicola TaxID=86259 RepID=A0A4Z1PXB7_9PEZI|nr:mevalonate kinase [Venturia nashicola]